MITETHHLGVGGSQAAFRLLLDALARPGRVLALAPDLLAGADVPPALVMPLALADLSQTVAVAGAEAARWGSVVAAATSCRLSPPNEADQVVVLDGATTALVGSLRTGSAMAPELGCRLAMTCGALHGGGAAGDAELTVDLHGPGVQGTATLGIDGLDAAVIVTLAAVNAGFPAGIDTWLVADDGRLVGLPRSLALEVR